MKYGAVDRIENNIAVIVFDDKTIMDYHQDKNNDIILKEGDRICFHNDKIRVVKNNRQKRKNINLQNKIFKRR